MHISSLLCLEALLAVFLRDNLADILLFHFVLFITVEYTFITIIIIMNVQISVHILIFCCCNFIVISYLEL